MARVTRKIISINEEKCDGCGLCVPSCAEGALQIVNGRARLIKESYCDGLGACLGECPTGALRIVELEVEAYDEAAVETHLKQTALAHPRPEVPDTIPLTTARDKPARPARFAQRSELRQWPVQLHLVPAQAPFFRDADLVLIADCVPFAYPNVHADFIRGSAIAVGCPKLDDSSAYEVKLADILRNSDIKSLKVLYMEVPCCRGLVHIAQRAMQRAEKVVPFDTVMISIGD